MEKNTEKKYCRNFFSSVSDSSWIFVFIRNEPYCQSHILVWGDFTETLGHCFILMSPSAQAGKQISVPAFALHISIHHFCREYQQLTIMIERCHINKEINKFKKKKRVPPFQAVASLSTTAASAQFCMISKVFWQFCKKVPTDSATGMGWCHILSINNLTLRTHKSVTASQPQCDKLLQAHDSVSDCLFPRTGLEADQGETRRWPFFSGAAHRQLWFEDTKPNKKHHCSIPTCQDYAEEFH